MFIQLMIRAAVNCSPFFILNNTFAVKKPHPDRVYETHH